MDILRMPEQKDRAPQPANEISKPDGLETPLSFEHVLAQEEAVLGGKQRSALCISGGGIRSATFAFGALQGLAELGILENFDYLSTVSGGGYIGSWLTAWKERWKGLNTPKKLGSAAPTVVSQLKPFALPPGEGPDPVQHLREYNNYLSPKLGFFSADTWTLVATVVRNMLLNWLVFIPMLMCALILPRIVLSLAKVGDTYGDWYSLTHEQFYNGEFIMLALTGLFFAIGIFNLLRYLPGVGHQNHTQGQFLKYCFGFIVLAALGLLTTEAWYTGGTKTEESSLTFLGLLFGIAISGGTAYLAYALIYWRTLKEKMRELKAKAEVRRWPRTKWVMGLLVAAVFTNFMTTAGAWLLITKEFRYQSWPVYVTFAMPQLLLAFGLAVTIFVGFTSRVLEDEDREWLARAGAWGILCVVSWVIFSFMTLVAPNILFVLHKKLALWADTTFAATGSISAFISAMAGLSGKAKAQSNNGKSEGKKNGILDMAGALAAPVFVVVFLTSLAVLVNWLLSHLHVVDANLLEHEKLLEHTRTEHALVLAAICLLFSWTMAKFIDINKFSLQAMYRSRLIRAYLGASNDKPEINKFTGFDQTDNYQMKDLTPSLKPFHIVNMALNLVAGERLAWQQRRAASFTVSPLHCGSDVLGYRPSGEYGGEGGISLGTAVAISGAAASPNMGYHSSPAITFIMTLFNARLGSWLGNPKRENWRDGGPHSAFDSIIREAFGLTNDSSPYVYLSDGGHFENLALYEMIRRHCRYIVVLDGGADPKYTYEDLGNALRKVRIDMKVPIEFVKQLPVPGEPPRNRFALAEIRYKEIDPSLENGYLIYIKPAILASEDPDVTAYKAANPAFPHESTGNQWFNESQTESYRMLGLRSVRETFGQPGDPQLGFEGVMKAAGYVKTAARAAAGGQS
jgi:Patatin-like phospholipase